MRRVTLMSFWLCLAAAGVANAQQSRATTVPPAPPTLMAPDRTPIAAQQPTPRPAPPGGGTPVVPVGVMQLPPGGIAPQAPQAAQARVEVIPTQNVRVELTITDSGGGSAGGPAKKTITMLIADGLSGRIRSSNYVLVNGTRQDLSINVDTTAKVRAEGRIQLSITFEYAPEVTIAEAGSQPRTGTRPASISESMSVLVPDGKLTLISQSADPASDRRVNIEVTATVVK